MHPNSIELDDLQTEQQRLVRLGAILLADHHGGEDLAQEGIARWLVARRSRLRRGEGATASRIAWVTTTVRRLASNERRRATHRRDREIATARHESVPSSREIAERAETLQRLRDAIDSLPEKQAEVLRDRYLGDLAPREIAERDGVSVHTVKSRIQRAREALKRSLEARGLGRDVHWSVASIPSVHPGLPAAAPVLTPVAVGSSLIVMKKVVFAFVALVFLGIVAVQVVDLNDDRGLERADRASDDESLTRLESQASEQSTVTAATESARDRRLEADTSESDEWAQPASSTTKEKRTVAVSSSVGLPLERAYFRSKVDEPRTSMSRVDGWRFVIPGDGLVSAPGHRARAVLASDQEIELEPEGLLTVNARGLRAGCLAVRTNSMDEAMLAETAFGFIGEDDFAVAVAAELWPNYNLRAEVQLELRSGREVFISFLPKAEPRATVELSLTRSDLNGDRRDLELRVDPPTPLLPGGELRVLAALVHPDEIRIERKSGPWGDVKVSEPYRSLEFARTAPGPWSLPELVVGRSYRLSLLAASGDHGEVEFEFDGEPIAVSLVAPTTIVAHVADQYGRTLESFHVVARFPGTGSGQQLRDQWTTAHAVGIALKTDDRPAEFTLPYANDPSFVRALAPMPNRAELRFSSAGHESNTVIARLEPGGRVDLETVELARRSDGITVVGEEAASSGFGRIHWKDGESGEVSWFEVENVVRNTPMSATLYLEDRHGFDGLLPPVIYLASMGLQRATRDGARSYRLEPTVAHTTEFVLDKSLAGRNSVDIGIQIDGLTDLVYTFYPRAIGTTRSLRLKVPVRDALLVWRVRAGENLRSPTAGEWKSLGPASRLPRSVVLSR